MRSIIVLAAFLLLSALPCRGVEFDLGEHGVLSFVVPDGWNAVGVPADKPGNKIPGFALAFKPTSDANAKCLLTLAYVTLGPPDKAVVHSEVLRVTAPFAAQSVETKATLRDFALAQGFGAYCVLTDASLVGKKATPGQYKVLGSGQVRPTADLLGIVSMFADDADGSEFKAMIKIIDSLTAKPKPSK